jgi:hypothetical protein
MRFGVIAGVPDGVQVDHRDGDGLNNARSNLRPATPAEQQHNRRKQAGKYPYKGIKRYRQSERWEAEITAGGRVRYLGRFDTPEQAARAYDAAAVAFFGEFARPNFLPEGH